LQRHEGADLVDIGALVAVEAVAGVDDLGGDITGVLSGGVELAVRLLPPVLRPEKFICIGLNYHDHVLETGQPVPKEPMFFAKFANSLIGHEATIIPPAVTSQVDYEAELAVVIGRRGHNISVEQAPGYVAGVMPLNDVSARDLQMANPLWTGGKAIDTFAPAGPALVLLDEVDDVQGLPIKTRVNDTAVQDSNTSKMIFSVAELVAYLSRIMTLVPGDLIATGTPAGVARSHGPMTFLQPGDCVEVDIEGIGLLRNPVGEPVPATLLAQGAGAAS
jgi:2-keto-4-pentenoate hydratase/2-oxohepta-3-ene-1,7-dioic acid hydratase in catechol pathway